MLGVIKAKYIKDYKIRMTFTDGRAGDIDLKEFLDKEHRPIFKELKDENLFCGFTLKFNTLVWPNGADLAPEYLYFQAFKDDQSLNKLFRKWGYNGNDKLIRKSDATTSIKKVT